MQDRSLLHSLTLMFKITKNIAPSYLCNRITYHRNVHNYNTRHKDNIARSGDGAVVTLTIYKLVTLLTEHL